MTGRRILDAAAVIKAARGVASKHVAFRTHELNTYIKTSAFAKAAQSQTDRVTLTVKAASALADRFNGPAPLYSPQASKPGTASKNPHSPHGTQVEVASGSNNEVDGYARDHSYGRLEADTTAEPLVADGTVVEQEEVKRHPPSNLSIPLPGAALHTSRRETEASSETPRTVVKTSDEEKKTPEPSPLPHLKVPMKSDDFEATDQVNGDGFYSSDSKTQKQAVSEGQAVLEQDQPSHEAFSEIFHSPRVARMLGVQPKRDVPPIGLDLPEGKDNPAEKSNSPQESESLSSSIWTPAPRNYGVPSSLLNGLETTTATKTDEEDVHALAADMANDAENIPSGASKVSSET